MGAYAILKFFHVLLAIVAVGANVTYGVWIRRAARDPRALPFALRGIKALDDRLATPAYALLLLTGLAMLHWSQDTWTTPWVLTALVLYAVAMVLALWGYTPTLRRQIEALETRGLESMEYRALAGRAQLVGVVLAVLMILIVFLMVTKPALWSPS
ncbi:MAG: DUF2269 family protein [Armatimonadota bacterium]|nr:DUF2269 family protein [Armatimonadota bacterium]